MEAEADPLEIIETHAARPSIQPLMGAPPPTSIRKFADPQLQASIDRALASLPADSKAADLDIGVDQYGVQIVGAVKLDHGWSILGGVSWDRDGQWGGKVSVRRTWR